MNHNVDVTIGDLFQAIAELEGHNWVDDIEYIPTHRIRLQNHLGEWCDVPALITKSSPTIDITFSDGNIISCADKHLIRVSDKDCRYAMTLKINDTVEKVDGSISTIINIQPRSDMERVYDLQINSPEHLYQTSDGFVHHNTSLAYLILKARDVNPGDILFINASRERKPEDLQDRIINFASTWPLGDYKYIVLDECLDENEEILLSNNKTLLLKDANFNEEYNVLSYNMQTNEIEEDIATVISKKEDDIFEVELEDGRTIRTTLNHPFLVEINGEIQECKLEKLQEGDYIVVI